MKYANTVLDLIGNTPLLRLSRSLGPELTVERGKDSPGPLVLAKVNLVRRLGPVVGTPKLAREMLFTPDTPQATVDATVARLQDESYYAYLDMIFSRPRPKKITTPVLVLAGARDRIFTVREEAATARAYGTSVEVFDGFGHNLMVEPGWQRVADRVDAFTRDLTGARSR